MSTRLILVSSLTVCALACGPARPRPDAGDGAGGTSNAGGTGNVGGGTGTGGMTGQGGGAMGQGGMTGGQGGGAMGQGGAAGGGMAGAGGNRFVWDGGRTVDAVRGAEFCSNTLVTLENVVVTAIEAQAGDGGNSSFWVADRGNQRQGMYVFKSRTRADAYEPKVGDVLTISSASTDAYESTWDDFGYRSYLRNPCRADGGSMAIAVTGTAALAPTVVPDQGFGDSMGGNARPNANFFGTLVTIPGQRTITNTQPAALARIAVDGGILNYGGFEVTGGILVRAVNQRTDAGAPCAYRNDLDAGIAVTFSNGLTGVWDTYTHAPCLGTVNCAFNRDAGYVPGTMNPTRTTTSVLWLTQCPN
jgi:hypothetical protein